LISILKIAAAEDGVTQTDIFMFVITMLVARSPSDTRTGTSGEGGPETATRVPSV
jgi:hypothetical protein